MVVAVWQGSVVTFRTRRTRCSVASETDVGSEFGTTFPLKLPAKGGAAQE